jgi:hypothetical protein
MTSKPYTLDGLSDLELITFLCGKLQDVATSNGHDRPVEKKGECGDTPQAEFWLSGLSR